MKKNSSIARWIFLILVLVITGVMIPSLAAAAPAGTCSFKAPCNFSSQLSDAQSCILSAELSRLASTPADLALTSFSAAIPLYHGHHDHCRSARHHCWERCNYSHHPHRCMERCMENRGCR